MKHKSIGIVGGGIMGMTLAYRLAKEGYKVTIYESAPNLGGLVSTWKLGEFEWDKFYHVILLSDFRLRNLLKELELEDKIKWVETKSGFYIKGKLYSMSDVFEFLRFPTLNLIDKFRLGITILLASRIKDWKSLEYIPVTDWLKKWSGARTYNNIWLPLLRAKLGESYKRTSAVFIWATIQRLYGARQSGLKKEMFGYVPGGYKRIVESFEQKLIVENVLVKTNLRIKSIHSDSDGRPYVVNSDGKTEEFDNLIVTTPSNLAVKLCSGLNSNEINQHNEIEYLGVICVAVLLDKSISPYYVTNITDTWVPFTGVIEMTALVDKSHFGGNALVYLPKYVSTDDPLFEQDDKEIETHFTSILMKMYPMLNEQNIKFKGVARARNVIAVSTLGYSDKLPDVKTSMPGVYIINSSQIKDGTLNVNETIKVAEANLQKVINDLK
jgi:protoporphyrinogen oxidase